MTIGIKLLAVLSLFSIVSGACAQERRLSVDEYRDRMKGGWIGQIIGVVWGAPTEFKFNETATLGELLIGFLEYYADKFE